MAKRRLHHSQMWESEKFASLSLHARLLMIAIIDIADDQGRFKAHPAWLRSRVFPYDDVSLADIEKWLDDIAANGTVKIYQPNGVKLGQLINWWDYQSLQYAQPSNYKAPEGWEDRIRITIGGGKSRKIYTHNWIDRKGARVSDTCNAQGVPIPVSDGKPTPSETPNQTPVPNTYSDSQPEHRINKDNDSDNDKDKKYDKDKPRTNGRDTVQDRYTLMVESVGQTKNYYSNTRKFQKWFSDVAMNYAKSDFVEAVGKMSSDYRSGKMNGDGIWDRTIFHLKNASSRSQSAYINPDPLAP